MKSKERSKYEVLDDENVRVATVEGLVGRVLWEEESKVAEAGGFL